MEAGFTIAEVEGDNDYRGLLSSYQQLPETMPRAIITNFAGLVVKDANGVTDIPASAAKAKILIDNGFKCITECYRAREDGTPHDVTPESLDAVAQQCGWPTSQPCFGIFGGLGLSDYMQWTNRPGWSAFLAEYVL